MPRPAMRRLLWQGFVSKGLMGLAGPERNICCAGGGERLIERGEGTFSRAASAK